MHAGKYTQTTAQHVLTDPNREGNARQPCCFDLGNSVWRSAAGRAMASQVTSCVDFYSHALESSHDTESTQISLTGTKRLWCTNLAYFAMASWRMLIMELTLSCCLALSLKSLTALLNRMTAKTPLWVSSYSILPLSLSHNGMISAVSNNDSRTWLRAMA